MKHRIALVAGAALALIATVAAPVSVLAQDETFPTRERLRQVVGPYEIGLTLQPFIPAVGQIHFIVKLKEAATGEPVDGAVVKLRAGVH